MISGIASQLKLIDASYQDAIQNAQCGNQSFLRPSLMQAYDRSLIEILSIQAHSFSIPIFQRPYAWRQKNCERLLKDILAIAERAGTAKHFFGSIVWVNTETSPTGITTFPVIDGKQRLTSTTLLLAALAKYARAHDNKAPNGQPLGYYAEMLLENGGHLMNIFQKHTEAFYKRTLVSDLRHLLHEVKK